LVEVGGVKVGDWASTFTPPTITIRTVTVRMTTVVIQIFPLATSLCIPMLILQFRPRRTQENPGGEALLLPLSEEEESRGRGWRSGEVPTNSQDPNNADIMETSLPFPPYLRFLPTSISSRRQTFPYEFPFIIRTLKPTLRHFHHSHPPLHYHLLKLSPIILSPLPEACFYFRHVSYFRHDVNEA
jgi:hypothetical protein